MTGTKPQTSSEQLLSFMGRTVDPSPTANAYGISTWTDVFNYLGQTLNSIRYGDSRRYAQVILTDSDKKMIHRIYDCDPELTIPEAELYIRKLDGRVRKMGFEQAGLL